MTTRQRLNDYEATQRAIRNEKKLYATICTSKIELDLIYVLQKIMRPLGGYLLTYSLNVSVNNMHTTKPAGRQASKRTRQQTSMCVSLYIVHTSTVVHRQ